MENDCKGDSLLESQWPSSWYASIQLLKQHGYADPQHLHICLDDSHPCLYSVMQTADAKCKYCGQAGTIDYYYLRLADKIKRWCNDPVFCHKMTAHWKESDHWLNLKGGWKLKKEIWDGERFGELSWFWDPTCQWILLAHCPICNSIVSSDVIHTSLSLEKTINADTIP